MWAGLPLPVISPTKVMLSVNLIMVLLQLAGVEQWAQHTPLCPGRGEAQV